MIDKILNQVVDFLSTLRIQDLALLIILLLLVWLLVINKRLRGKIKNEIEEVKYEVQKIDKKMEPAKVLKEIKEEEIKPEEVRVQEVKAQEVRPEEARAEPKIEKEPLEIERSELTDEKIEPKIPEEEIREEPEMEEKVLEIDASEASEEKTELEKMIEEKILEEAKEEPKKEEMVPEIEIPEAPEEKTELEKKIEKTILEEAKAELKKEEMVPEEEEAAKPVKKIILTEEHNFVLRTISDDPDRTYQKEGLYQLYRMVYPRKDKLTFDLIISDLEQLNYVIKSDTSSEYKIWYEITNKGLEYLNRSREE